MNEILLSLANRSTGFIAPGLRGIAPVGGAWTQTPEEAAARELLRLRAQDDEFYLKGLLLTVEAFPEIADLFGEVTRSYNLYDMPRTPASVHNATLVPSPDGQASVVRLTAEFPTFFDIVVDWHSAGILSITGGAHTDLVRYKTTDDGRLVFAWPAWTGITGLLAPFASVVDGYQAIISHTPIGYPHEIVRDQIANSTELRTLIRNKGLTSAFFYAGDSAEAVAVAALALGLHNHTVYG